MGKGALVTAIAKDTGVTKEAVHLVLSDMIEKIAGAVKRGEHVYLRGLGRFELRQRLGRMCRNPNTQEPAWCDPYTVIYFVPSQALRLKVRRGVVKKSKKK